LLTGKICVVYTGTDAGWWAFLSFDGNCGFCISGCSVFTWLGGYFASMGKTCEFVVVVLSILYVQYFWSENDFPFLLLQYIYISVWFIPTNNEKEIEVMLLLMLSQVIIEELSNSITL
jgi:hypothetical protein